MDKVLERLKIIAAARFDVDVEDADTSDSYDDEFDYDDYYED